MELGTLVGFVLSLCVFSYLLGDNFLYRLAVYVFVGLAAAYFTIATVEGVLIPLIKGDDMGKLLLFIAAILGLLLLLKALPSVSGLSNGVIAYIVAVGAAVAIIGAITGTLMPLTLATGQAVDTANSPGEGAVIVLGVITTLIFFQFVGQRHREDGLPPQQSGLVRVFGRLHQGLRLTGQFFVIVTLGALYGAAILTSLTIFSERISFWLTKLGG